MSFVLVILLVRVKNKFEKVYLFKQVNNINKTLLLLLLHFRELRYLNAEVLRTNQGSPSHPGIHAVRPVAS